MSVRDTNFHLMQFRSLARFGVHRCALTHFSALHRALIINYVKLDES